MKKNNLQKETEYKGKLKIIVYDVEGFLIPDIIFKTLSWYGIKNMILSKDEKTIIEDGNLMPYFRKVETKDFNFLVTELTYDNALKNIKRGFYLNANNKPHTIKTLLPYLKE